ncbi:DUF1848 domain-containing protein [Natranaerofaba carboxydovora]|uniref:DUF1848 domain-containing protein n=1 Tax=Natranaerofaba carboxydovora TaxID=2742683 RepID=UPI001F137C02|nr:DUF1848 domain-containing protein [Natranaerofaba carboxydovora]UMZ75439.1 hypothetical protein ACONDI_03067 [Natranaerofaba carboxydovora]
MKKRQIISASRRTDIPALYGKWFMNRIEEGWGIKYNPYNKKAKIISLKPKDVDLIVFWSKNYRPFLECIEDLNKKGYNLFFHYTITGVNRKLETNIPMHKETIETFKIISNKFSPKHIFWRYDPIIFTRYDSFNTYLETFNNICQELEGYTERCYISFANIYGKVFKRLKDNRISLNEANEEIKKKLANQLVEIAEKYNIQLYSCCNEFLINDKIQKASCIDVNLYKEIFDIEADKYKKAPSRKGCGCFESIDIGLYDTCSYQCLYCYANNSKNKIMKNIDLHDPFYPALHKGIDVNAKEMLKDIPKEFNEQLSIFDIIQ